MAAVSKIKLPDNTTLDVHDSRISGVTSSVTENSTDAITSGGVYTAISNAIEYYTNNEIDTILIEN